MSRPVLRTALCDFLGIEYPICLAGMGGKWTPPELVAAVSEAGGLGVMGGTGTPVEDLRKRIRRVRELTDKPFGVDLLLPVVTGQVADSSAGLGVRSRSTRPCGGSTPGTPSSSIPWRRSLDSKRSSRLHLPARQGSRWPADRWT